MTESSGSSFDVPRDADPVVGETRTLRGLKTHEKVFFIVSFTNIIITIVLTIYRLARAQSTETADFTFALVLLINCLFCGYYVVHGVLKELKFELVAFIAAAIVVTVYCVIEYADNFSGRSKTKLIRMIATLILAPIDIWLAYTVAQEFGFLTFRIVGVSEMMQRMYTQTEIFTCFLKFDVQVAISFVVLVMQNGSYLSKGETVTLIVGVPYTVALAVLGWMAMRKEMKTLMWTFDFLCLASPAFVLYKVVAVYQRLQSDSVRFLDYALLAAAALALAIRGMVLVDSLIIMKNFNYGLKEIAFVAGDSGSTRSLLTGIRVRRDGSVLQQTEQETT